MPQGAMAFFVAEGGRKETLTSISTWDSFHCASYLEMAMINYPISIYCVVDGRCSRAFLGVPLRGGKLLAEVYLKASFSNCDWWKTIGIKQRFRLKLRTFWFHLIQCQCLTFRSSSKTHLFFIESAPRSVPPGNFPSKFSIKSQTFYFHNLLISIHSRCLRLNTPKTAPKWLMDGIEFENI
jgi:hypothetical protein